MKYLHKASAILSLALLPALTVADCPYKNPNYKPQPPQRCQVPDGVYSMTNRLSGAGAASNYTILLFVKGSKVDMLVKDKTSADKDYLVSAKHPPRPGRFGPRDAGPQHHSGYADEDGYYDNDNYADEMQGDSPLSDDSAEMLNAERRGGGRHHHGGSGRPSGKKPPVFCNGDKINICFGPDSRRAAAMPGTLQGSVELTVNGSRDALNGKVILNGSITSNNTVVLRKQSREAQ